MCPGASLGGRPPANQSKFRPETGHQPDWFEHQRRRCAREPARAPTTATSLSLDAAVSAAQRAAPTDDRAAFDAEQTPKIAT